MNIKQAQMQAESLTRNHTLEYGSDLRSFISGNCDIIELEKDLARCYMKNNDPIELENKLKAQIESLMVEYLNETQA